MVTTTAVRKHPSTVTTGAVPAQRVWAKHHHSGTQRIDAESQLANGTNAERKLAARILGCLQSSSSYQPLIVALQRKNTDRGTQLEILCALQKIGDRHGYDPRFSSGFQILENFVMEHLGDAALVEGACNALQSAGTYDEISDASQRIMNKAIRKYPRAYEAAASLYSSTIHLH